MKQLIKNITIQIYKVLTYLIPVNNNMLIFQSSNGRNYTGNPRYIYEEMVRDGLDQEFECILFFFFFCFVVFCFFFFFFYNILQ